MDDEDEKKGTKEDRIEEGGVTQIPLIETMVFDASLPLKPPPRPPLQKSPDRISYSPDNDPDTIDLFENDLGEPDIPLDESVTSELRQSANHLIDELVDEYKEELGDRLRAELTEQLTAILEHLDDDQNNA
jgi:hypothetical protein